MQYCIDCHRNQLIVIFSTQLRYVYYNELKESKHTLNDNQLSIVEKNDSLAIFKYIHRTFAFKFPFFLERAPNNTAWQ